MTRTRMVVAALALTTLIPAARAGAQPPAQVAARAPVDADLPYDATGRRDPFRPPRAQQDAGEITPLQRFDLGQLKLVAIIYDTQTPRAVVEDESGLGYIVKIGTPIGTNNGAVRAIEKGRVLVREQGEDLYGETQSSEVVMELAAGDERGKK
jgi:type IV pilus assembly protein PilP